MENNPQENRENVKPDNDNHTAKPIGHRVNAGDKLSKGYQDTTDKNAPEIDDTDKYLAMEQPGVS